VSWAVDDFVASLAGASGHTAEAYARDVRQFVAWAERGGCASPDQLDHTTEALIGAVYLQHGIDVARDMVHRLFDPLLVMAPLLGAGLDWKTSLQELTAVKVLGVPDYHVEESGPDHQKSFRAVVRVGGRALGSGAGRTKKAAEQQAAEAAWRAITGETAPDDLAARNGDLRDVTDEDGPAPES